MCSMNVQKKVLNNTNRLAKIILKLRDYLAGLMLVALATFIGHLVQEFFAPANIIMIYLLCVTISAVFWGLGPSIMVSILSVIAFDFFFVTPFYTVAVDDTQYIFTFVALLLVGIIISYLTSGIRSQSEIAKRREREMADLYSLGQDLAVSNSLDSYIQAILKRMKEAFGYNLIIFLPDKRNVNQPKIYPDGPEVLADKNLLSAAASYLHNKPAIGYCNQALSDTEIKFLPLVTARGIVGVMVINNNNLPIKLTVDQERLLGAYTDLAAVAIEGITLAEEVRDAQVLKATERLQTALLNAISHDLRTPLVSVIGVLSGLQEEGMNLNETDKSNLIRMAHEEAEKLNHLITNLLDESRIESGALKISKQPAEVQDLIGAALEQLSSRIGSRPIQTDIPKKSYFLSVDTGLMIQTFANIIDNALKYSPPDSPIEIKVSKKEQLIYIEVADRGVGIPPQDIPRVFDKFYRIQSPDNVAGTGMGLSICRGIVEAHGGKIQADNRAGGGTIITIALPVEEVSLASGDKLNA